MTAQLSHAFMDAIYGFVPQHPRVANKSPESLIMAVAAAAVAIAHAKLPIICSTLYSSFPSWSAQEERNRFMVNAHTCP